MNAGKRLSMRVVSCVASGLQFSSFVHACTIIVLAPLAAIRSPYDHNQPSRALDRKACSILELEPKAFALAGRLRRQFENPSKPLSQRHRRLLRTREKPFQVLISTILSLT